jgi:hypothetical protein
MRYVFSRFCNQNQIKIVRMGLQTKKLLEYFVLRTDLKGSIYGTRTLGVHTYIYTHTHTFIHHIHAYIHIYTHTSHTRTHTYIYIYTPHTRIHAYMHTYIYTHACIPSLSLPFLANRLSRTDAHVAGGWNAVAASSYDWRCSVSPRWTALWIATLTLWSRSSSKCYLIIKSLPQRKHHTSPLQRSTG